MAKGFPDWFGMSVFPVFGGYSSYLVAHNHTGTGVIDTVKSLTGKGVLRAADLEIHNIGQDGVGDWTIYLDIDGINQRVITAAGFSDLSNNQIESAYAEPVYFYWEDSCYRFKLLEDVPFITSIELKWFHVFAAGAPAMTGFLDISFYQ